MNNSKRQKTKTNAKKYFYRVVKNLYLKCRNADDKKKLILGGIVVCFISMVGVYFLNSNHKADAVVSEEAMSTFSNLLDNSKGEPVKSLSRDELAIKVYNCTKIKGLAANAQLAFKDKGYTRIDTGSSEELKKSKIYIRSEEAKLFIENDFDIDNIEVGIPTKYDAEEQYDVVIVLGKDYKKIGEMQ